MKRAIAGLGLMLCAFGSARAETWGRGMHGPGDMGRTMRAMAETLGPELWTACHADLSDMGLPSETLASLEGRRFELRKKMIRTMADLKILKLEFSRLVERRGFDLTAAQKMVGEISVKESEIRSAHVELLHAVRSTLTEEQWQELLESSRTADAYPMKHGMGRMEPHGRMEHHGPHPCGKDCEHHRYRHGRDTSDEAEEFFKDE